MPRAVTLNAFTAGMTRLRVKGGASPETLYEAYNCYVTASRTIKQRPASVYTRTLPTTSKGLVYFNGVFYTFSAAAVTPIAGTTNLILKHPTPGYAGTVLKIYFAQPFMGLLYVVAGFSSSGSIPAATYHYWLQMPAAWTPFTVYKEGDLVQPTVQNGLYYKAYTANPPPAWQPMHQYFLNDAVQPTVYNGFLYRATILLPDAAGPTASSDTEPVWPTDPNSFVLESSAGGTSTQPTPPTPPPPLPVGIQDGGKYVNLGGSGGRSGFGNTPIRVR